MRHDGGRTGRHGALPGVLGAARGLGPIVVAAFLPGAVRDVHRPAASAAVVDLIAEPVRPRAERGGLGPSGYDVALAVNGLAIVVLQPLLLPLFDRIPRIVLLPTGCCSSAAASPPPGSPARRRSSC